MICLLGTQSWRNWINKQIISLKFAEGRPQGHMAFKQNLGGKVGLFRQKIEGIQKPSAEGTQGKVR